MPKLSETVLGWFRRRLASRHSPLSVRRGPRDHVIILDGTMSSLVRGEETHAGTTYRLLQEVGGQSVFYEAGLQWRNWRATPDVMMGRGINRQIRRAYGFLASRYRPGDRIFLIGFSRGAYAVRSLAGVIDRVGLLRADQATERNIRQIYRLYKVDPDGAASKAFRRDRCHEDAPIEMVGVWDTVKALGVRLPFFWHYSAPNHAFHSHELGSTIRNGFQALALDETRQVYEPVLWVCRDEWRGTAEQVWFRGCHGDVGGQIGSFAQARPLSNIPLVWMLEKAEGCGILLPDGWMQRFPCDVTAPSVGTWGGLGKIFLLRATRIVGADRSESIHASVQNAPDYETNFSGDIKSR